MGIIVGAVLLVSIGFLACAYWKVSAPSPTVGAILTTIICLALGVTGFGLLAKIIQ